MHTILQTLLGKKTSCMIDQRKMSANSSILCLNKVFSFLKQMELYLIMFLSYVSMSRALIIIIEISVHGTLSFACLLYLLGVNCEAYFDKFDYIVWNVLK